jgi:ABC-type Fe3+/spermidine/putrescine transport system ATPase subunit
MSVVKNLCKEYGGFSLDIGEWELPEDKVTVLWGASGAGKTTVVRALSGIDEVDGFQWNHEGKDLALLPSFQRGVSVVLQHYGLFPHLSVQENILFPIEAQNKDKKQALVKMRELVDVLQIQPLLERKARVLSGGEQQRVALARALIVEPSFLILDEPFSALDGDLKKEARQLLKSLLQHRRLGLLLVTHDLADVAALAQHVVILQKGRIIASQTPEEFLKETYTL